MRVLLVEDRRDYANLLRSALRDAGIDDVTVVRSRNTAIEIATSEVFDLIICDLKIPTEDDGLDLEREHGLAVYGAVREDNPGVPILIHSAFGDETLVDQLMAHAPREDLFGSGQSYAMVRFCTKGNVEECVGRVRDFREQLDALEQIEIRPEGEWPLDDSAIRALRMFARLRGGMSVKVRKLGGLSDATTVQLTVASAQGRNVAYAVAKLGAQEVIDEEKARFAQYVNPILPAGSFASLTWEVRAGAGRTRGLFYSLASDSKTLFDVLAANPPAAAGIVTALQQCCARWEQDATQRQVTVGDIRSSLVTDQDMAEYGELIEGLDWRKVEACPLIIRECPQHGDLHGANVLVNPDNSPLIIDFGNVGPAAASLDAVTLEMSVITHPDGRAAVEGWPTLEAAGQWTEIERWAGDSPIPDFLYACRDWALVASDRSRRAVYANAYALALKQLKYDDVDRDIALAVASAAARGIEAS